jgi:hypothetical protein
MDPLPPIPSQSVQNDLSIGGALYEIVRVPGRLFEGVVSIFAPSSDLATETKQNASPVHDLDVDKYGENGAVKTNPFVGFVLLPDGTLSSVDDSNDLRGNAAESLTKAEGEPKSWESIPFQETKVARSIFQESTLQPKHGIVDFNKNPEQLVGRRVTVKGFGNGLVVAFRNVLFGDAVHSVDFKGTLGTHEIVLRLKVGLFGEFNNGREFSVMVRTLFIYFVLYFLKV